jgi:hypothetical protein
MIGVRSWTIRRNKYPFTQFLFEGHEADVSRRRLRSAFGFEADVPPTLASRFLTGT